MSRTSIRTFTASLSYYQATTTDFAKLACRSCRAALDVFQPDPNQPEQFLGTCSGCGRWFRIGSSTSPGLTVVELPEIAQVVAPPAKDGKG